MTAKHIQHSIRNKKLMKESWINAGRGKKRENNPSPPPKKPNYKIKSKAADLGYQNIFIKNFIEQHSGTIQCNMRYKC